jgi:RimJ/RimL family protein N-acetyltransferase
MNLVSVEIFTENLSEKDFKAINVLASDAAVSRHMEWDPHTSTADTVAFMQYISEQHRTLKESHFVVRYKTEVAGVISLINFEKDEVECTIWLGKKFWGKGIANIARKTLLKTAFADFPQLEQVVFKVDTDNEKNHRAHQKLGSILIPDRKQVIEIDGQERTYCFYKHARG